ncbi:MAG: hypothetical protein QF666_16335 [Alphaproteobacteria bacterium]|nr:hypothetical protein [Alphaproteobacteria bacterium]
MPVSKNRRKNRKKAPSGGKKKAAPAAAAPLPPLPDRRAIEGMMANLLGGRFSGDLFDEGEDDGDEALHQAQEIMYDAWDSASKRERVAAAKRALKISDLCADAHVLLAEEAAGSIIEARRHYERGVAAGEAALGPEAFEHDVGHFWGILESRPYMRARAGLAECLWRLGERADAVAHLWDMLRLNPNDNQGLRYSLTAKLFVLDDLDGAQGILADYEEQDFAEWSYSKALLTFKKQGPSAVAGKTLKAAIKNNPHVPALLLGARRLPKSPPPHYAVGSKDEAVLYVIANRENWSATRGALPWLAETSPKRPPPAK